MSIDAIALLRIPDLSAPRSAEGVNYLVSHRGDASLLHTFRRFQGTPADEHSLALRQLLGDALDAHEDPRGILFFPDVAEPTGASYEAIAREVASAGVWAPKVDANHVPARYATAKADTHEALVSKMIRTMGRDVARHLDLMVQVHLRVIESTGGRADAVEGYAASMAQLRAAMGDEFTETYDKRVRKKIEEDQAAEVARIERGRNLWAEARRGEALISSEKLFAFLEKNGGVDAIVKSLTPAARSALEAKFAAVDPAKVPADDLAKPLVDALRGREKKDP